jgi:hypothetical protein
MQITGTAAVIENKCCRTVENRRRMVENILQAA